MLLLACLGLSLGACATRPSADDPAALAAYEEANDPLEPLNRMTFAFNQGVETVFLRPTAKVYRTIVPSRMRDGLQNALHNLSSPVILLNDLLQGKGKRGGKTFARFLINTTLGIGGLFDVAKKFGLEKHNEDFGQTLAVWGVGEGFYFVLPVLGPSSARDVFGRAGNIAMDPIFWSLRNSDLEYLTYVRRSVSGIDLLSRNIENLEELKRSSVDYYAAIRSAYRQNRADEIRDGGTDEFELPDYLLEEEEDGQNENLPAVEPLALDLRFTDSPATGLNQ